MKAITKKSAGIVASGVMAAALAGGILFTPAAAHAQAPPANVKTLPPITLDLRDAPVRQALEQLFNNAKVDFSIANEVQGFVTLKITDQPFENALRLILRSSSIPLTFVNEGGVYIVKPRITDPNLTNPNGIPPPTIDPGPGVASAAPPEVIPLNYIDALDLQAIFPSIRQIRTFVRQGQGTQGGQQGGGGGGLGGLGGGGGIGGGGLGGLGGGGSSFGGGGSSFGGGGSSFGGGGFGGGRGF